MLPSLVTVIAILQLATATTLSPPILYPRHGSQHGDGLDKRADCGDGTRCLLGSCCGDGCAMTCCALDNGGLGCGIAERCQFEGNVFVGCCGNFLGGCTGEATRVTVHTPYSTVTLGATTATATATGTGSSTTATTTREQMFTAISWPTTATATATATTTTSTSSSVPEAKTTSTSTSTTHRSTTTAAFSQSQTSSLNSNGGSSVVTLGVGMGMGMPVLAGMVALGAVLL